MLKHPKDPGRGTIARVVAVIGTRAQVIKMAPVLAELEHRRLPYRLLLTGQHHETIDELLDEFGIQACRERLYGGPEIKGMAQALRWLIGITWVLWRQRHDWAPLPARQTLVLTHGDTFTTLVAAFTGWAVGATVAHVEGGLRSFNWRHPFPEELTRVIVTRFSQVAYCPGPWACSNLKGRRLEVIDTQANTILDALRQAVAQTGQSESIFEGPYAVVSVHRFENLYSKERLAVILNTIHEMAKRLKVIIVLHPTTRKRLGELGHLEKLEASPEIQLRPRMTYVPFMQLISGARLVVTDGGSNQEELSYLGVPTLLMRMTTERREGIGENVTLSQFNNEIITQVLETACSSKDSRAKISHDVFPAAAIAEDLSRRLMSPGRHEH